MADSAKMGDLITAKPLSFWIDRAEQKQILPQKVTKYAKKECMVVDGKFQILNQVR